ncbi:acyl carrier protein [Azospira restricta]|uniref:Acyl carrier protein n=1 Tax=Azospira restricta TaxID=404405 RepID=A0A974Y3Z4_9RHOO|nr:acyl carrier protein [Azospira restricta]QRJ64175.1 acyl carrier protein [Azospira restricta]
MPRDPGELRAIVVATLQTIAPEIDAGALRADRPLRQQVDLDSMDWLNFLIGLSRTLGVAIPETDYRRLVSIDELVRYLREKTG